MFSYGIYKNSKCMIVGIFREWIKPNAGEFALWEFNEKVILFGTTMVESELKLFIIKLK